MNAIAPPLTRYEWLARETGSPVRALVTVRTGGVSAAPWFSFNLGDHVGDDPQSVLENRRLLGLDLPCNPVWLNQVHGIDVLNLDAIPMGIGHTDLPKPRADAAFTTTVNCVVAIQTADCLPVLIASHDHGAVGGAHAGWRGLCSGVIEALIDAMPQSNRGFQAWFGPAIGPQVFQVGAEVRQAFLMAAHASEMAATRACFVADKDGRFLANIYQLARIRLARRGVIDVSGGDQCTVAQSDRYFSYRRDGQTGRMASCIWLTGND